MKEYRININSKSVSLTGLGLELQIGLHFLGDFLHKALERKLADEQLSRLLVLS